MMTEGNNSPSLDSLGSTVSDLPWSSSYSPAPSLPTKQFFSPFYFLAVNKSQSIKALKHLGKQTNIACQQKAPLDTSQTHQGADEPSQKNWDSQRAPAHCSRSAPRGGTGEDHCSPLPAVTSHTDF